MQLIKFGLFDKQRIDRFLARLSQPEIKELKSVIKETFVD